MKKSVKLHIFNVFYSLFGFALASLSIFSRRFLYQYLVESNQIQVIIWLIVEILSILIISFLSTLHRSLISLIFGQTRAIEMIEKKLKMFDNFSYKKYTKKEPGSYFSLFFNEIFSKGEKLFSFLFLMISLIFPIITILSTIFYINPIIGAIVLVLTIVWSTFPSFFQKFFSKKIRKQLDALENLNSEFSEKLGKFEAFFFFNKINLLKKNLKPTTRIASLGQKNYRFWSEFANNLILIIKTLFVILTDLSIVLFGIYFENLPTQTIVVLVTINTASFLFIDDFSSFIIVITNYLSLRLGLKKAFSEEDSSKKAFNFKDFSEKIDKISIKNLSFSYKNKLILENVNLEILKGKKYLLRGDNGVGKSTLLKILMGIERDYKGEISLNSTNLNLISDWNIVKNISFIDNNPLLIEGNLSENISFYSKYDNKKIDVLVNLVNLSELKGKTLIDWKQKNDLSVGQKQRINFASHIIEEKPIVIIDEAFSNLDKENVKILVSWLLKQKITLLFILHNLDENLAKKFDFHLNFVKDQVLLQKV